MNEMYWITRLDVIVALSWFSMTLFVIGVMAASINYGVDRDVYGKDSEKARIGKKWIKPLCIGLFITLPFVIFVPSEKDMYKIIGIGGTYDYLRQNETAQELPDKVIQALDTLLEKQIEESSNKESN